MDTRTGPIISTVLYFVLSIAALAAAQEPTPLMPRPDGDAAEKEVRSLFAAELKAAARPEQKAKLAGELLTIAAETEKRDAALFAVLQLARDLALDGRDRTAAFAVGRAIAARFEPPTEFLTPDEQFAKAQELWSKAEKAPAADRLRLQAKAVELYAYALPLLDGIERVVVEKKLAEAEKEKPSPRNGRKDKDADLKLLIGTWEVTVGGSRGLWAFREDGVFLSGKNADEIVGKWRAEKSRVVIILNKNPNAWQTFNRPIETTVFGDTWTERGIIKGRKLDHPDL
jgi:hypothetical protein